MRNSMDIRGLINSEELPSFETQMSPKRRKITTEQIQGVPQIISKVSEVPEKDPSVRYTAYNGYTHEMPTRDPNSAIGSEGSVTETDITATNRNSVPNTSDSSVHTSAELNISPTTIPTSFPTFPPPSPLNPHFSQLFWTFTPEAERDFLSQYPNRDSDEKYYLFVRNVLTNSGTSANKDYGYSIYQKEHAQKRYTLGSGNAVFYISKDRRLLELIPPSRQFRLIAFTHLRLAHMGIKKTFADIQDKYKGISRQSVTFVVKTCTECSAGSSFGHKGRHSENSVRIPSPKRSSRLSEPDLLVPQADRGEEKTSKMTPLTPLAALTPPAPPTPPEAKFPFHRVQIEVVEAGQLAVPSRAPKLFELQRFPSTRHVVIIRDGYSGFVYLTESESESDTEKVTKAELQTQLETTAASALIDFTSTYQAPQILHSSRGRQFLRSVVNRSVRMARPKQLADDCASIIIGRDGTEVSVDFILDFVAAEIRHSLKEFEHINRINESDGRKESIVVPKFRQFLREVQFQINHKPENNGNGKSELEAEKFKGNASSIRVSKEEVDQTVSPDRREKHQENWGMNSNVSIGNNMVRNRPIDLIFNTEGMLEGEIRGKTGKEYGKEVGEKAGKESGKQAGKSSVNLMYFKRNEESGLLEELEEGNDTND